MSIGGLSWWVRGAFVLAAVGLSVVSCTAEGNSSGAIASIVALRIGVPVHEPTWSEHARALFALTGDHRIARIDLSQQLDGSPTARTVLSAPFADVGENLVTRASGAMVYLPQPQLGRVVVVGETDLRPASTLWAGPSPSLLAVDSGADDLLALSQDRSRVTPVDLHDNSVAPPQTVQPEPGVELDGAQRGRRIDFHVSSAAGIVHYEGNPGSLHNEGQLAIRAGKAIGDLTKSSRLYVAERGTDRLLAVDSQRSGHGLEVVAEAHLGEPVEYVGVDETRVYAATEHRLVVLATNSFEGYADQRIPIIKLIDFRRALTNGAHSAVLSGLAVGPDRVYLALRGQPYLVNVAKPNI
jgi:hypothetical protein